MKKLIILLTVIASALSLRAEHKTMAILVHDGTSTYYYNKTAFSQAYADAVEGDAIYLSAGIFEATTIAKNISIYGAGMGQFDGTEHNMTNSTRISGEIAIEIPSEGSQLYVEGVYFDNSVFPRQLNSGVFSKCYLYALTISSEYENAVYATFYNSYVACSIFKAETPVAFFNSVVKIPLTEGGKYFTNCLIIGEGGIQGTEFPHYKNSILMRYVSYDLDGKDSLVTSDIEDCILMSYYVDESTLTKGNVYEINYSDPIFKDGTFYQLTDEAAATYVNSDGGQIGLYGGDYPFDITPQIPIVGSIAAGTVSNNGSLPITVEITQ
ncbi:MAG: hypothetical protein LIP03_13515 [Bacteroidales bacterium]|nr:hypothetical protein [Bacteroidales bacterium]